MPKTPAAAPADDEISFQPFGEATVAVAYYAEPTERSTADCPASGGVTVIGALIEGELVDVKCFAAHITDQWQRAIELEREACDERDLGDWHAERAHFADRDALEMAA